MSLQSRLFKNDLKLEAAAVSDPAHIFQGAFGEHVRKIQFALIQLDGAVIDPDGKYGPGTAAAVQNYKRKRNIINTGIQTHADNIVGKMTIASLDAEIFAKEGLNTNPVVIRALSPGANGGAPAEAIVERATLRLGFKIDLDVPDFPDGNLLKIRLAPRTFGVLEIINGTSGVVKCRNVVPPDGDSKEKTSFINNPAQSRLIPAVGLIPDPHGPLVSAPGNLDLQNGGTERIISDRFIINVDAFRPGNAFIDAATGTSAATIFLEVRPLKLGVVTGQAPTKADSNSRGFLSSKDSEPNLTGINTGRPINPKKGVGRNINLGGEQETPGFEDYSVNIPFSGYLKPWTNNRWLFRPWTEDPVEGVKNSEAINICIRGTPVKADTILTIKRIAAPGCRLTYGGPGKKDVDALKLAFPFQVLDELPDQNEIVIEFP